MTMRLVNELSRILTIDGVRLMPGLNLIDEPATAERLRGHPAYERRIAAGDLRLESADGEAGDLLSGNARSVIEAVRQILIVDDLARLKQAEEVGKGRVSVIEAIDTQLSELLGEPGDDEAA